MPGNSVRTLVAFSAIFILLCGFACSVRGNVDESNLESECRPYVEKALKDQLGRGLSSETVSSTEDKSIVVEDGSQEQSAETPDITQNVSTNSAIEDENETKEILIDASSETSTEQGTQNISTEDQSAEPSSNENTLQTEDDQASVSVEQTDAAQSSETTEQNTEEEASTEDSSSDIPKDNSNENQADHSVEPVDSPAESVETTEEKGQSLEEADTSKEGDIDTTKSSEEQTDIYPSSAEDKVETNQEESTTETIQDVETAEDTRESDEIQEQEKVTEDSNTANSEEIVEEILEENKVSEKSDEETTEKSTESVDDTEITEVTDEASLEADGGVSHQTIEEVEASHESNEANSQEATVEESSEVETKLNIETTDSDDRSQEATTTASDGSPEVIGQESQEASKETPVEVSNETVEKSETETDGKSTEANDAEGLEISHEADEVKDGEKLEEAESGETVEDAQSVEQNDSVEGANENELIKEFIIPENLRTRNTISENLHLDEEFSVNELALAKASDTTLRELKRLYDSAIKPLENLYKYRDLSNRHFGDPEIFSKPLILFMGPWSGGKSSIINYLLDNDYKETSLRTGAEPSPAYFNIVTWGSEPEILDGTQLAADWTFSGLQKFGQGLEDRLRGLKLPNKLLEMVNIVEIPGILEVRKQVSRVFPFNDACQWFIDRADIIFLVYDPSKLDVGPETEAILDQLKGREYQTRVILNKADTVKPEELLRVQGALIWNISPLMASPQPPIIYTTSLWSTPYNSASPVRLLQAQERAFLKDIRLAIDKRVDNKIASARRFAVRVRNHAKMVDCYLTTYYNHKTFFGNRKLISDEIINRPQEFHIYEGLSTLKNISRYDLPDPEAYRDFFKVNPLYEFQPLSATCTYFKGCPINRLDVCIAYDLPELVGKHKKLVEQSLTNSTPNS